MINLHVYPSPFTHESRILRETSVIADAGYFERITMVGVSGEGLPERECIDENRDVVRLPRSQARGLLSKLAATAAWSRRVFSRFSNQQLACINCHSLPALPLSVRLAKLTRARLIYDAHELETETNGLRGPRRYLSKVIERRLLPNVDAIIVVSESIRDWYARTYDIEPPHVVLNCTNPSGSVTRSNILRDRLGISPRQRIFLYLGVLASGRGIEVLCDALDLLPPPRPALVLMGEGALQPLIVARRARNPDIHWAPAVAPAEVLQISASADVGVCLIENTCLSYYYAMPNKLFEYIGAGIPVLCSDLPEMRRVILEFGIGALVTELTPVGVAATIKELQTADLNRFRAGLQRAAERFDWTRESNVIRSVYERLGFEPGTGAV